MTESDLHTVLKRRIETIWAKNSIMVQRIENTLSTGVFDTFVGTPWGAGWIELKIAGPQAKPAMRPGQPGFGHRCMTAGVPAHVLCASADGYLKLLNGWTIGEDWRDHVALTGSLDDLDCVRGMIVRCTTPPGYEAQ